jgi:hypothetical protein
MKAIKQLRKEVATMQRARKAGTVNFEGCAIAHKSKIERAHYRDIEVVSDTLAVVNGRLVITHENLQYFPAKVRYFLPIGSK